MSIARKRKKPTAKEALARLEQLETKVLMQQLQIEALNHAWAKKFSLAVGIFEAAADSAATIGELRRWLKEWNAKLDAIDPDAPDAEEHFAEIMDEFEIELKPVNVEPEYMIKQENVA